VVARRRRTAKGPTDKTLQREHTELRIPLSCLRRSRLITLRLYLSLSLTRSLARHSPSYPSYGCRPRVRAYPGRGSRAQASRIKRAGRRGSSPRGEAAEIDVGETSPVTSRRSTDRSRERAKTRIDFTRGHRKWRCTVWHAAAVAATERSHAPLARYVVAPPGQRLRLRRTPPGGAALAPRRRATFESHPIVEPICGIKNFVAI